MRKAIIYILYHPAALFNYNFIRNEENNETAHILVICSHPYLDRESIEEYTRGFTKTIFLPDIDYENNVFRGFWRYFNFLKIARNELSANLKNIETFNVISDVCAYLPVNAILSELKKNTKFNKLFKINTDYLFEMKPDILKSAKTMCYTFLLRLYPAFCHKRLGYMYFNEFQDKDIQIISPFGRDIDSIKQNELRSSLFIIRPQFERNAGMKDTIIFYSTARVRAYGCELSLEAYKEKLAAFFKRLAEYYRGYTIVCKLHPLDFGKAMPEMEGIQYELYKGSLISQIHLNLNAKRVKACYSVVSTSLLYSAFLGIPSYTLYKYLDFKGKYPEEFFKTDSIVSSPLFYNIRLLDEIGVIDSIKAEPKKEKTKKNFSEFMEWPNEEFK